MKWKNNWQVVRHHIFVGVTLMGCIAPWVTPRHFPVHTIPVHTNYDLNESLSEESSSPAEIWTGQLEVLQNAC